MQPTRSSNSWSKRSNPEFSMPLPRFHPAIYQSPSNNGNVGNYASSRTVWTPSALKTPTSSRQQQPRQYNEATRKLIEYQQEILRTAGATNVNSIPPNVPGTPSLLPCRSPGPATPLTLEDHTSDYLTAGAIRRGIHPDTMSQRELVERMIAEEQERRQGTKNGPSSPPVSPAAAS